MFCRYFAFSALCLALFAASFTLTGCNQTSEAPSNLDSQVDHLESAIQEILSELENISSDLAKIKIEQSGSISSIKWGDKLWDEVLSSIRDKELFLNIKQSNGFQILNSSSEHFFVLVKEAQPYLDGYKITLSIGNPFNVTYVNPKIKVRWNHPPNFSGDSSEQQKKLELWENSFKKKEFSIIKDINPGSWADVELFIAPCSLEELEWVGISIQTTTVQLFKEK